MTGTCRKQLLDAVFDLLSDYLVNQCPEDENWEDFDPEIDQLRATTGDLAYADAGRLASIAVESTRYVIDVEFRCDNEPFATERHTVDAVDWPAAKLAAFNLADASPYSDDRIPGLTRCAWKVVADTPGQTVGTPTVELDHPPELVAADAPQ